MSGYAAPYDSKAYFDVYKDVGNYYTQREGEGIYDQGERDFLAAINQKYGTKYEDLGEVGQDKFGEYHALYHPTKEGMQPRLERPNYVNAVAVPVGQANQDDYFDTDKFEDLLGRLEASKGRQQRQKSLEGRRDIFAQGLTGMMSNF